MGAYSTMAAAAVMACAACATAETLDPDSSSGGNPANGSGGSASTGGSGAAAQVGGSGAVGEVGGSGGGTETSCGDGVLNGDETDVDCGGSCPPCATGSDCATAGDCTSGFCATEDGVCCATACDGACEACAEAKTAVADGTCAPISTGTDPDVECFAQPVAGCDVSGMGCDGAGACRLYATGTVCEAPSCMSAIATGSGSCDGAGSCLAGAQTPCGAYACDASTMGCKTSCAGNGDCTPPATCNLANGTCGNGTVTFDTLNFMGMTFYPLDTDVCTCCGTTTTAQTANAFCVLAGMTSAVTWTTGSVMGNNCYCYDCITIDTWASNCCSGQQTLPVILTVTCQ
jgi:hypothetical protein